MTLFRYASVETIYIISEREKSDHSCLRKPIICASVMSECRRYAGLRLISSLPSSEVKLHGFL